MKIVNENAFTRAENENEFQHEVTVPMSLENVNDHHAQFELFQTAKKSNYIQMKMWIDFYVHFFLSFSNACSFISVVTREIDEMNHPV